MNRFNTSIFGGNRRRYAAIGLKPALAAAAAAALLLRASNLAAAPSAPAGAPDPASTNLAAAASGQAAPGLIPVHQAWNVFMIAEAFPAHKALLADFKRAMAANDYAAMETISSNAVAIFPRDAIWRYNLACSSARRGHIQEARDALLAAAGLGFSDAAGAAADTDLAIIRRDPAFQRAMAVIRNNQDHPESVPGAVAPLPPETTAPIATSNTVWNMETGGFTTLFTPRTRATLYAPPTNTIPGKTGAAIRRWLAEGTASGNAGDLYDNRDRAHSRLDPAPFRGMVPTAYSKEASDAGADIGFSLFTFPGRIAIGNSSTANTVGEFWGSCARKVQNEFPHILIQQYLSNCVYVYPQHHDYLQSKFGDVFPTRTPFLFISPGSSWTDRPILAAMATALAAMRPETKDALASQGMISPALQYLIRMASTNVADRADYATPKAHPVVFDGKSIDTLKLAKLAHSIDTNSLPLLAPLRILADESVAFKPGSDYPDRRGERLFDSPFAIARVWRAPPATRKMTVAAAATNPSVRFHWFVGQGDKDKIAIRELDGKGHAVEITVSYHEPHFMTPFGIESCRADIVCVADDGTHYSPPSFVTWYFPPVEKRRYDEVGRIAEIDYASCADEYADPAVATHFDFRDVFSYGPDGARTGKRIHADGTEESLP